MTRGVLQLFAALAAFWLLREAPAQAQTPAPVRIGVIQAVTGPFTKNGTENWTAMQIARDMINERGGIPGHKRAIEYVFADAPNPTAAITETERIITKDGVKITAGSGLSPLAIAVSQAAERHGVFHWETAGGAEIITRRGHKFTFQVAPSARRYAEAAVDFTVEALTKRLGKSAADLRVAHLWENRAFGKSVGENIRAYAPKKGIKLIYDEGYDQFITVTRGLVLVPERRRLFPFMSVLENLEIGAYSAAARPQRKETIEQVYALLPVLAERHNQRAGSLSGGEQQMLAIGRALMAKPCVLLLDEPTEGLAPRYVSLLYQVIQDLRSQGHTILIVEQSVHHLLQIADWAYVLEHGHIVMQGAGRDLAQDERLKTAYLGL